MNKKVFVSMLILCIVFLTGLYIAKIFFPNEFVIVVQNQILVKIGDFVDKHLWISYIVGVLLGCLFDYVYFGAVCRKYRLDWKLIAILVGYNLVYQGVYTFTPKELLAEHIQIMVALSVVYMIFVPMFFTIELKPLAITYSVNYASQSTSLYIRGLSTLLTTANFLTMLLMTAETYLWLVLCLLIFNYKGGERSGCR